jgi:hypothetical protein
MYVYTNVPVGTHLDYYANSKCFACLFIYLLMTLGNPKNNQMPRPCLSLSDSIRSRTFSDGMARVLTACARVAGEKAYAGVGSLLLLRGLAAKQDARHQVC